MRFVTIKKGGVGGGALPTLQENHQSLLRSGEEIVRGLFRKKVGRGGGTKSLISSNGIGAVSPRHRKKKEIKKAGLHLLKVFWGGGSLKGYRRI